MIDRTWRLGFRDDPSIRRSVANVTESFRNIRYGVMAGYNFSFQMTKM